MSYTVFLLKKEISISIFRKRLSDSIIIRHKDTSSISSIQSHVYICNVTDFFAFANNYVPTVDNGHLLHILMSNTT
jgi:hypothetical protein